MVFRPSRTLAKKVKKDWEVETYEVEEAYYVDADFAVEVVGMDSKRGTSPVTGLKANAGVAASSGYLVDYGEEALCR